ncbi:hypothetical protein BA895_14020 [Humibacillus sp. DSM 29435]|nr:hypothetical protein BA895_14020 [Humibacillus sp. DSM 29435]
MPRVALTRRSHVWGETWRLTTALLLGLALWALIRVAVADTSVTPAFGMAWFGVDLALGFVSTGLLLLRRRWPVTVTTVTALLSGLSAVSAGASAFALVSLSTRRRWREIALVAVPWTLAGLLNTGVYPDTGSGSTMANIVIGVLSFTVGVSIGWAIGERRAFVASLQDRALTAEREQTMRVAQAKVAERARIAREMHDVLAHRISLVAMHSGALTYRTDLTPTEVATTAEVVRANANLALTELREVLGVLRDVPASTDDTLALDSGRPAPPQPTLSDLPRLVADVEAAETRVRVDVLGDLEAVPERVSRSAYRIIQECLTNARKHAPSMPVGLTIEVLPADANAAAGSGSVALMVRNGSPVLPIGPRRRMAGAPAPADVVGSGLGLVGVTERAVLAGGELTYGHDRRGDFVVTARLPWSA